MDRLETEANHPTWRPRRVLAFLAAAMVCGALGLSAALSVIPMTAPPELPVEPRCDWAYPSSICRHGSPAELKEVPKASELASVMASEMASRSLNEKLPDPRAYRGDREWFRSQNIEEASDWRPAFDERIQTLRDTPADPQVLQRTGERQAQLEKWQTDFEAAEIERRQVYAEAWWQGQRIRNQVASEEHQVHAARVVGVLSGVAALAWVLAITSLIVASWVLVRSFSHRPMHLVLDRAALTVGNRRILLEHIVSLQEPGLRLRLRDGGEFRLPRGYALDLKFMAALRKATATASRREDRTADLARLQRQLDPH